MMKKSSALAALAVALSLPASASAATLGATSVYVPVTSNSIGAAQAYRFTAQDSGQVDRLSVYLDRSNTANQVILGLYGGSASSAGARLASCAITRPTAGAWNRCTIAPSSLTGGANYWLALLQPSGSTGQMQYREGTVPGGPPTYLAWTKGLSSLPPSWTNGASWNGGYQASVYADLSTPTAEAPPAPAPTPTPTPSPSPSPAPSTVPAASFSVNPNPAVRNQAVTFSSTGSCPDAPCTYRWFHWDVTNGAQGEIEAGAPQPNTAAAFTYTGAAGQRGIVLRVTDADGQTAQWTQTFSLVEATPTPTPTPTASQSPTPTATPSPSPTPSPAGFPDASSTGVPAGTTLTSRAGITVKTAGAVINAVDAPWVSVEAPNVTIRNSRIGQGTNSLPIVNRSTGLLVEDTTIVGRDGTGISFSNYTARRVEITGTENGFNVGNDTVIEDSWVHDLDTSGDAHTDGIQFSPGAGNIIIRHNTLDPVPGTSGATSPIIMHTGGDPQNHDVWIEDNYLDGTGSSVALYCPRQTAQRIYINRNRMLKGVFGGYTDSCRVPTTATRFQGNVDYRTGALIPGSNW